MSTAGDHPGNATARIFDALDSARSVYVTAHEEVTVDEALRAVTRDRIITVLSEVATTLRRLAPALAAMEPPAGEERPEVPLILLRLLTDSLSITLAQHPDVELLVAPHDVESLLFELRPAANG